MGGCASTPKGIDLTKEALPVDASPSVSAEATQTTVEKEPGNGGDVEKPVPVADKDEEAKPEAAAAEKDDKPAAEVKDESPAEAVAKKEEKGETVEAKAAEKTAEPTKVEEKTDVSPVTAV